MNVPVPVNSRFASLPLPAKLPSPEIRLLATGWLLLSLLLFAGCAAPRERVRVETQCPVPTARLNPTPEPALRDETNGQLLNEIDGENGWWSALKACNRDKADIRRLIEQANRKKEDVK